MLRSPSGSNGLCKVLQPASVETRTPRTRPPRVHCISRHGSMQVVRGSFADALGKTCLCNLKRCPKQELQTELDAQRQMVEELMGARLEDFSPYSQELAWVQFLAAGNLLSIEQLGPLVQARLHTAGELRSLFTSRAPPTERILACQDLVQHATRMMRESDAFSQLIGNITQANHVMGQHSGWTLQDCQQLHVLCLGSVRGGSEYLDLWATEPPVSAGDIGAYWSSSACLWQLAFALLLQQLLPQLQGPPVFSDPCFTPFDEQLIKALGGEVVAPILSGKNTLPRVETPTLFYMPHCVDEMHGALVESNWTDGSVCNVALIGNSLRLYTKMGPECSPDLDQSMKTKMHALIDEGKCVEFPVPDLGRIHDVGLTTLQVFLP